jgi:hypothetical protein
VFGQTHAALGWVVGLAAPASDRRLRAWCTAAAILPDIDAAAMLLGKEYYDRWHHTFGHNVFTGALCVALAAWHFWSYPALKRWTAVALVTACFASHLLTDAKLSGWLIHPWWPLNTAGYQFHPNYQLGAPINMWLVYVFMILPWLLAFWKPVTPLELLSPRLDRLVVNAFRKRDLACATCAKPCNNRCDRCHVPACMGHAKVDLRFRVTCPACVAQGVAAALFDPKK